MWVIKMAYLIPLLMTGEVMGGLPCSPTRITSYRGRTTGQTDTLGDLIDRLLPTLLDLFPGFPGFGYVGRDLLLESARGGSA
jgi:hypothetical protein